MAIIDREPRLRRVIARNRDIAVGRIGADDGRAKPRQRLRQNAAAAADIEDAQAGEAVEPLRIAAEMIGGAIADIGKPDRVEFVQRRHRSARVPPLAGEPRKARDFVLVDRACGCRLPVHARYVPLPFWTTPGHLIQGAAGAGAHCRIRDETRIALACDLNEDMP